MANVSPGVYSKIIDLSTYVGAVPGTIGFIAALTSKGEDNKMKFIASRAELISEFGEPNITEFGKNFGQGLYNAYNYLGESGAFFMLRALPDDAYYANIRLDAIRPEGDDATTTLGISYISDLASQAAIYTGFTATDTVFPICILRPIGRGVYYNALSVKLSEVANPFADDAYFLDVYETQADGSEVIVESFEVSFNPRAVDDAGDSIFIVDTLNMYSNLLRAEMVLANDEYSEGYKLIAKVFDVNLGDVSIVDSTASLLIDTKQDFSQWATADEDERAKYMVIVTDARGNKLKGWLGASGGDEHNTINIWNSPDFGESGTQEWIKNGTQFDANSELTYILKQDHISLTMDDAAPLKMGSDGELRNPDGSLNTNNATQLLAKAYGGTLVTPLGAPGELEDSMYDTENTYFSMVFDAGYPADVKTAISNLAVTRDDCVAILDNGDNPTYTASMTARNDVNVFNNYFTAIYEEFNKVYDPFTGTDVWFSPVYHMSSILPRNDRIGELWFAAAGFNRAAIDNIKELRFNPKLDHRDQMYLKQLNPIVQFNEGYVVWGQLTSQAKPSALQDLNIVRLVLYVKRALERYCRFFIFEQNDSDTWSAVAGDINSFLGEIQTKRGLDGFSVDVGATEYERKMKKFHVNVTLTPTRVVEKIELNFFIK